MASKYKKSIDSSPLTDNLDMPAFEKEMFDMIKRLGFPEQDKEIQDLSKDLHHRHHCNSETAKEITPTLENHLFLEIGEQTINDMLQDDANLMDHKQTKP